MSLAPAGLSNRTCGTTGTEAEAQSQGRRRQGITRVKVVIGQSLNRSACRQAKFGTGDVLLQAVETIEILCRYR